MSAFTITGEANYAAQVIRADNITTLDNMDNLVALHWAGYQALVPKTTKVGDLFVVFPPESQLSETFVSVNNLSSVPNVNNDPTAKGYLGKNRRVKALRLRGNVSNLLALDVKSLSRFTQQIPAEGTAFDTIDGLVISQKYYVPVKNADGDGRVSQPKWRRVDEAFLPQHFDTAQYYRNSFKFAPDDYLHVTQKIHGTSVRVARTIVKRKLSWVERLLKRIGVRISETDLDVVGGSRRVIKDPNNPDQKHFYGDGSSGDIWTKVALELADKLPAHVVLYGEVVGWLEDGRPIQKGYTYGYPKGHHGVYIYRVAVVTPDGGLYDLSWEGVKTFCNERGLNHVPELWSGLHRDFDPESWTDRRFNDSGFTQAVQLSDSDTVDEGVVVMHNNLTPLYLKLKGPRFYEYESKILDEGNEELS